MADVATRALRLVGVAIATSGPGATNLVTGIATAMLDSIPIVCITGNVSSKVLGTDAFQEVDITGITLPVTKHNFLVSKAEDLAHVLRQAFQIAQALGVLARCSSILRKTRSRRPRSSTSRPRSQNPIARIPC